MAPLAWTLALLAMTVATAAIEVVPLDMAPNSFDDQYQGCRDRMTKSLQSLMESDFKNNALFAQGWAEAKAKWMARGSRVSPLSSPAQAIALMAYMMRAVYGPFNKAVSVAGRSRQEYLNNFHFKALHFLLTDALATLRSSKKCHNVFTGVRDHWFKAKPGDKIRFGQFVSASLDKEVVLRYGTDTVFEVYTCQGVDIQEFSYDKSETEVLIPPFETFNVTSVTQNGDKPQIKLHSTGTHSKYNCVWANAGSTPRDTPLGGLLLATVAMAVATVTL